jgi:hypothetical protein
MDVLSLGVVTGMGLAAYGLLRLCEWLSHDKHGEQS